jgi:hypothetical protein
MYRPQLRRVYLAPVCALLLLPIVAHAQVLYGSITGNITDKSGAAVSAARVEALNVETGVQRESVSDERGASQVRLTYTFGKAIDYSDNSDSSLT